MADERAVLLGRAVSMSACRLGVELKDRRPSAGDAADLCRLAAQCLELAGCLDVYHGSDLLALAEQVADAPRIAQPAEARRRRDAA